MSQVDLSNCPTLDNPCASCAHRGFGTIPTRCTNCFAFSNWELSAGIDLVPSFNPTTTIAKDLLYKAADIMTERGKQYDSPAGERSMVRCVQAFNAITGQNLTEAEGWLLLQLLKDVRQWQREGYHADSAEDCIAYAALKAEALANG